MSIRLEKKTILTFVKERTDGIPTATVFAERHVGGWRVTGPTFKEAVFHAWDNPMTIILNEIEHELSQ
jgi:hypothetical protein